MTMAKEFETLSADFQEAVRQAEALHQVRIMPLQELGGGQTGARLFLVSISQEGASSVQHAILKLDRINPKARAGEMDLHERAVTVSPPAFAHKHIPAFPFQPVRAGEAYAIFYAIAGHSLQNFRPLASYTHSEQLEAIFRATNDYLLREWNESAAFEQALHPQNLFPRWLSYRLKPGGNIERFFTETLRIPADIPGLAIRGSVFPNPFFYAREAEPWGKARPIDAIIGIQHGDLNTGNILTKFSTDGKSLDGYYLIDFALFKDQMPLFYDHCYLIMSYLTHELGRIDFSHWIDMVIDLAENDLPDPARVPVEVAGCTAVIRAARAAFYQWVEERFPSLHDDLWAQYRLAAVAVGLNFCNKPGTSDQDRLAGLIFAAAHLRPVHASFGVPLPTRIAHLPIDLRPAGETEPFDNSKFVCAPCINKLPDFSSPFIGRKEEVSAVVNLMQDDDVRLLTLTGPGGTGKSRLVIQAAEELIPHFKHGMLFVPLADVCDPALVLSSVALKLGLRESGTQPLQENVRVSLEGKEMLIVLDNFEQVIDAAPVITTLLSFSERVKVLVTSRVLLNLTVEREFVVPPMRLPENGRAVPLEELKNSESVQLFLQRAQSAQRSFALTEENAAAVAEICRRLDGLPLAIELAAARVKLLPPQVMLARLGGRLGEDPSPRPSYQADGRLNLLTGGGRDLPTRQQTLRQTIDWSYDLLEEAEKVLFARLSVFVGGWTLESAEAICNAGGDLGDVLGSLEVLMNSSLIRLVSVQEMAEPGIVFEDEAQPRFRMLETIRAYALDKLDERGERDQVARQHAQYFARRAQVVGAQVHKNEGTPWMSWVAAEHDNLRAVLAWSLEPDNDVQLAIPVLSITYWFWFRRGYLQEGREWCRRVLEKWGDKTPSVALASLWLFSGSLAMWQGDLNTSLQQLKEGTRIAQLVEDEVTLGLAFMLYGIASLNQGDVVEAAPSLGNSLNIFRAHQLDFLVANVLVHLANTALSIKYIPGAESYLEEAHQAAKRAGGYWILASILNNQGEVARVQGDYRQAEKYYEQSEALFREGGDVEDHNRLIHNLGYVALYNADLRRANQLFQKSLLVFRELGNRRGIAECLAGYARLALMKGRPAAAATLLGAAESIMNANNAAWWPADEVEFRRSLGAIKEMLPEAEFDEAWKTGQSMTLEQALAFQVNQASASGKETAVQSLFAGSPLPGLGR